jgi:phosphoesterase RecJ-like protein
VGYPGRDDADLISVLSTIEGADVVIIFTEQKNGSVKVSWRSQPGYDVSKVALRFGGGGHAAAAGADIEGNLEEVQTKVIETTQLTLDLDENIN